MSDTAAIIDAINKAWTDRYGGDPVADTKALITRVVKLAEDRDSWMTNAKANQKEYIRLEEKLKRLTNPETTHAGHQDQKARQTQDSVPEDSEALRAIQISLQDPP